MAQVVWMTRGGHDLVAQAGPGLRLVVTRRAGLPATRFVVERALDGAGRLTPVHSGYRDDVAAAMRAAEAAAARLAGACEG